MTLDAVNRRGKAIRCTVAITAINPGADNEGAYLLMMHESP
jgi:hypothetical protein